MPARVDTLGPIDLEATGSTELPISDATDEIRVQAVTSSGTWDTAVLQVEMSLVGGSSSNWDSLDEPLSLTSSEDGTISTPRYLGAVRFIRVRVSTDQSGTPGEVEVSIAQDSTWLGRLRTRTS